MLHHSTTPFKLEGLAFFLLAIFLIPQQGSAQQSYVPGLSQKEIRKEIRALDKKIYALPIDTAPDIRTNYELLYSIRSGEVTRIHQPPYRYHQLVKNADTISGRSFFEKLSPIPADTATSMIRVKEPAMVAEYKATIRKILNHVVRTKNDPVYKIVRKHRYKSLLEYPGEWIYLSLGQDYMIIVALTRYTGQTESIESIDYMYLRKIGN